jgi:hypothetical protein
LIVAGSEGFSGAGPTTSSTTPSVKNLRYRSFGTGKVCIATVGGPLSVPAMYPSGPGVAKVMTARSSLGASCFAFSATSVSAAAVISASEYGSGTKQASQSLLRRAR